MSSIQITVWVTACADRFWRHRGQIAPKLFEQAVTHTGIWTERLGMSRNHLKNAKVQIGSVSKRSVTVVTVVTQVWVTSSTKIAKL